MAAETVATDAPTYAELLARIEALEAGQSPIKKKNKLTIIAWGGDLDRIWPTTILATTAAASLCPAIRVKAKPTRKASPALAKYTCRLGIRVE